MYSFRFLPALLLQDAHNAWNGYWSREGSHRGYDYRNRFYEKNIYTSKGRRQVEKEKVRSAGAVWGRGGFQALRLLEES